MIERRTFLLAGAALALLPQKSEAAYAVNFTVLESPYQTIGMLHRDLFEFSASAPSPVMLNALGYLGGVMNDPRIEQSEKQFILNGAAWLNEQSETDFKKAYYHLTSAQRNRVLETVIQETWGDNWIWTIYSYLFEALLCDPVYGANTHAVGWYWLHLEPGYPRPKSPFTEDKNEAI